MANTSIPVDVTQMQVQLPVVSTETGSSLKSDICSEAPLDKEKKCSSLKSDIFAKAPLDKEKKCTCKVPVVKLEICEESSSDQEKTGLPVISSVESRAHYNDQWSEDENKCTDKFIWRHKEIQLLIQHYKSFRDQFKSGFMKKKDVWQKLAISMQNYGYNVTGEACDKKWRNLLFTYKGYLDNNRTTGCGRRNWQYYDQFHELYQKEYVSTPEPQTKRKINVGVQTTTQSKQSNTLEREPTCSFTTTLSSEVVMLPLSTNSGDTQSSLSAQRKKSLEVDEQNPVVEILKKKHKSDALWQLQVKELLFKNIKAQEETNEAINRLTEVLTRYIHER